MGKTKVIQLTMSSALNWKKVIERAKVIRSVCGARWFY
jgi:hypothetical protein